MCRRRWFVACLSALAWVVPPLEAFNVEQLYDRYTITTWSSRDGLPEGSIVAVVQDGEGFLWLGSSEGLVRFDGTSFELDTALPLEAVRVLCATRDGSVWVGFGDDGRIARVRGGVRQVYGPAQGVGTGVLNAMVEDGQGTLWLGGGDGLSRLVADRFVRVSESEGLPTTLVTTLGVDTKGNLLVGTRQGVFRRSPDSARFERVDGFDDGGRGVQGLAEDPHGYLWAADGRTGLRRLGANEVDLGLGQARGIRVLVDRHGGLWVSTTGAGVWRLDPWRPKEGFRIGRAPISGGRAIFEDREGNIWIGTIEGLVRLSERRVREIPSLGTVFSIEATPDGSVWVASVDELVRLRLTADGWRREAGSIAFAPLRAIHSTRDGTLWVADAAGLLRVHRGTATRVAVPPNVQAKTIEALTTSSDGGVVWMATRDAGLFRWRFAEQALAESVPALGTTRLRSLACDRRDRVWLTSIAGRLGLIDGPDSVRWFDTHDGLGVSTSYTVHESGSDIWVAGMDGLRLYKGGRFLAVLPAHHERWGVPTLIEDIDGDFWLGTSYGIARVPRDEITRWTRDPSYRVHYSMFDTSDGLSGRPGMWGSRTSARSVDGQLWFVTGRGLALLAPEELKRPRLPVSVRIDRIQVGGRDLPPGVGASIPAGTTQIVVDYSALELTSPDKVRFRYRLEGFDAEWVEAGRRRQATYDRLPARSYRFRVSASHTEGAWTPTEAVWALTVTPRFYETPWFGVALVASLLAVVWGFWLLRLRRSRRQFSSLLAERVRLSRELHDTLLQSLVGVALQLEAASNSLDANSPARERLVACRRRVESYIREARLSIWNLRAHQSKTHDLVTTLKDTAERISVAIPVEVVVGGVPARLDATVESHLLHIGQEAILNAARHANARRIRVELHQVNGSLTLRVIDDGSGFDLSRWTTDASGHMGLVSMRERAEQIGAGFVISSTLGSGTTVEVVAPLSPVSETRQ